MASEVNDNAIFPHFKAGDLKQQIVENACFAYPHLTAQTSAHLQQLGHPHSKPEDIYRVLLWPDLNQFPPYRVVTLVTNEWATPCVVHQKSNVHGYQDALQDLLIEVANQLEDVVKEARVLEAGERR